MSCLLTLRDLPSLFKTWTPAELEHSGRAKRQLNSVDTKAFAKLFRKPNVNHHAICLVVEEIVRGAASAFRFRTADDRSDAVADVVAFCLKNLRKFKLANGSNPAGYFHRMAFNKLREVSGKITRTQSRETSFDTLTAEDRNRKNEDGIFDA